jgi:hypothetical protein
MTPLSELLSLKPQSAPATAQLLEVAAISSRPEALAIPKRVTSHAWKNQDCTNSPNLKPTAEYVKSDLLKTRANASFAVFIFLRFAA